jgi:8-oxo-dGTP pyrophosphatase MutT (NUDIX family)
MRTVTREIVGAFIFSGDGLLLLGRAHPGGTYEGLWVVPGGGMESDETKLQAVQREVLEETGIDISSAEVEELTGVSSGVSQKTLRDSGETVQVAMTFYDFKVTLTELGNEIAVTPNDDLAELVWFKPEALPALKMGGATQDRLKAMGLL